jgi:uncharacterized protein
MNKRSVQYYSDGIRLDGFILAPADLRPNEKRPAVIICSGFQGLMEWVPSRWWPQFVEGGFVCLAFDYRGFCTSDGERGRIIPDEEIVDVRNSITFLQQQSEVDPERIGRKLRRVAAGHVWRTRTAATTESWVRSRAFSFGSAA